MPIGSSQGIYYPDESALLVAQNKESAISIKPVSLQTTGDAFPDRSNDRRPPPPNFDLDQGILGPPPGPTPQEHGLDATQTLPTMPLGSPTEPAGALESSGGTGTPAKPPIQDYDYDSWRKANPGVEMAPGQHYPDTYKLPNHMTFSDESIYHGVDGAQGGKWGKDEQGNDTFTPGRTNLEQHSMKDLRDYFSKVEPNAKLLPPNIEDVPHHDWVENIFKAAKDAFKLPGEVFGGKVDPTSEQGIEKAADLAGFMVMGPAPWAGKLADGTLGSFAGVKSKTVDKAALGEAQVMEANAAHPDDILKQTGFGRGADGRWKYEIDDSKSSFDRQWSKVNPELTLKGQKYTNTLPNILDHPELYKAYPHLRDVRVTHDTSYPKDSAEWRGGLEQRIIMGPGAHTNQGTLMHEIQHAIQDHEGFAKGGSPGTVGEDFHLKYTKAVNDLIPESSRLVEKTKAGEKLTAAEMNRADYFTRVFKKYLEYKDAGQKQANANYMRLAGETEARNTDTRLLMTEAERRATPPTWTEDLPRGRQIVVDRPAVTSAYGVMDPETGLIIK